MFHELLVLRDQLTAEFHEQSVDVTISNGNVLTVKFINSPLQSATREIKQQRADAVAVFVTSRYTHPLRSVATQFVSKTGVVSFDETFVGHAAH